MTLDELATGFKARSDDPVVQQLGRLLLDWKTTDATVADLAETVDRYFGTTWIASEAEHDAAFGAWVEFRDEVVNRIGGMTMNERLYHLSLFDRFDGSASGRHVVYQKLLAEP